MDKVITFEKEFEALSDGIEKTTGKADVVEQGLSETKDFINDIYAELSDIPGTLVVREGYLAFDDKDVEPLNLTIKDISDPKLEGDFNLTALDTLVSIAAGVIASVIDIVFVGTPEVVKIYRGGENFDGSVLTKILRQLGNCDDKLSRMLKWLSDKCEVPYDVSVEPGVVIPNNHRLRNPGHDPLFGLLFAVADIILGTATLIDDNGNIRIIVKGKEYPPEQKYLSVIYYLGHLLSDVCTARGLPVPGFFATQFFTTGESDRSIAKVAEQMYKDGYDLRHLASMSTPVVIKNMITDTYLNLVVSEEDGPFDLIAEREIREHKLMAYKYRLRLVSDAVSCGGNALKFFLPPTTGNMTALNLPEWTSLLKDTIADMKYQLRDKSVERAILNREIISDNWKALLGEEQ